MRIHSLLLFHSRIIPIGLGLACLIAWTGGNFRELMGPAFLLLAPAIHAWEYEFRHPNEYLYYHNQGLSKVQLWSSTLGIALLNYLMWNLV